MATAFLALGRQRSRLGGQAAMRSGARAARLSLFATETSLRLRLSGPRAGSEAAHELAFIADNFCALLGVRPRVEGRIPREPCLLVANHVSYLDPLLLASLVPSAPLAKREVGAWPVLGEVARRAGALFVERGNPASGARALRECIRTLRRGVPVLVFPEGSTTRGDTVLPFKRGCFGAAQRAGVPIVPVALCYERLDAAWVDDSALVPHVLKMCAHPLTHASVRFLEPLADVAAQPARALAQQAERAIRGALQALRAEARRPLPAVCGAYAAA